MRCALFMAGSAMLAMMAPPASSAQQAGAEPLSPAGCARDAGGESAVAEILDAQTLRLADGRLVRLANLSLPPVSKGLLAYDATNRAVELLRSTALGQKVELRYGGRKQDRYGVHLAHVSVPARGAWLQKDLVEAGLALFTSQPDNRACAKALLAAEDTARREGRGLWRRKFFDVVPAHDEKALRARVNSFQLIEGTATEVTERGAQSFVNFGRDWRSDFTIRIPASTKKAFGEAGAALKTMKGRRMRVRGWLVLSNGPLIEITHPEQIEFLPERK